jgi:quinol-cytochrome oxidoreductase complex cytochrome b subunit
MEPVADSTHPRRATVDVVARVLVVALGVALVVLVATGIWLWRNYRPAAAMAWNDIETLDGHHEQGVRVAHRWASWAAVWLGLALAVVVVRRWWVLRRTAGRPGGGPTAIAGVGVVLVLAAASFTGYLLPWDQLGLWAVTVGTNMRGFSPIFRDNVRFVLVGSSQISTTTYRRWFVVHVAVLSIAAAGSLALVARGLWRAGAQGR